MSLLRWIMTPFRRGPRRPLAHYQPERASARDRAVPLGMEGLDMDAVARTNRRNDALERVHIVHTGAPLGGAATRNTATHVALMPEDETYAARYHRAFQKKGS